MADLFYPQHIFYVRACEFSFEDHLKQGLLKTAIEFGLLCLNSYKKCGGHTWRNVGVYEYKLGLAYMRSGSREEALQHFYEAKEILVGTHRAEHQLLKNIAQYREENLEELATHRMPGGGSDGAATEVAAAAAPAKCQPAS